MCLAIPGKILDSEMRNDVRYGRVQFGGVVREACLDFVPEAAIGDYVIVHVGFAISRVDREEAEKTFELLEKAGLLEGELTAEQSDDGDSLDSPDSPWRPKGRVQ
jgi:hydrogenase expression/formation protein HypC